MSTISQHHSLPLRTTVQRPRTRGVHARLRPRSHSQDSAVTPVMGPANHAPGVSIMGAPGGGRHRDLMGGPDADPRVSVMGSGDQGTRLDVFGDNDLRFVDSLFTRQSSVRRHARRATISRASDPRGRGLVWGLHHLTTKEKP